MTEESYYINDTERHLTEAGLKSANLTLLPYRAVLFSTRAPIGKVGIVGSPMNCNQGFKNFICGDMLNPVFLFYTLKFKKDYLVSLGTGTIFKELSKKTVESLKIIVPNIELQNRFEEIYNQADKSKFRLVLCQVNRTINRCLSLNDNYFATFFIFLHQKARLSNGKIRERRSSPEHYQQSKRRHCHST